VVAYDRCRCPLDLGSGETASSSSHDCECSSLPKRCLTRARRVSRATPFKRRRTSCQRPGPRRIRELRDGGKAVGGERQSAARTSEDQCQVPRRERTNLRKARKPLACRGGQAPLIALEGSEQHVREAGQRLDGSDDTTCDPLPPPDSASNPWPSGPVDNQVDGSFSFDYRFQCPSDLKSARAVDANGVKSSPRRQAARPLSAHEGQDLRGAQLAPRLPRDGRGD
jgi:hypothetical protein